MDDLIYFETSKLLYDQVKNQLEGEFPSMVLTDASDSKCLKLKIECSDLIQELYTLFAIRNGFWSLSVNMIIMKNERNPRFEELIKRIASERKVTRNINDQLFI